MTDYTITRRTALKTAASTGAILIGAGTTAATGDHVDPRKLNELREATAKYHDPRIAEDDGYRRDDHCVSEPGGDGVMGFHYLDFANIDTTLDYTDPEVLVYERRGGRDHLVAVEFLSTADPNGPPPTLFGHEFHPAPHLPFTNWELHVWCWKPNPRGLFANFNPRVDCPE